MKPLDPLPAAAWWRARRKLYNRALAAASFLALMAYIIIGSCLPEESEFEFTLFTFLGLGLGFLLLFGMANLCYNLGAWVEKLLRPSCPAYYRTIAFRLGFWFSLLVPFILPIALTANALR